MFALVYELTDECDFGLYVGHEDEPCKLRHVEFALVDTEDAEPDFHQAHLCCLHAGTILSELPLTRVAEPVEPIARCSRCDEPVRSIVVHNREKHGINKPSWDSRPSTIPYSTGYGF